MFEKMSRLAFPDWRWLLAVFAFVVAAGVATPLVAQAASVTVWNLGAQVTDLRIGPSDAVWTMTGGAPRKLNVATNEVTTYSHGLAGTGVLAVDGAGMVWSPDSFGPPTTYVVSRLNPTTLEVTTWPVGTGAVATSIAVDGAGNVWFARASNQVWRLNPATNAVTEWTLPISGVYVGMPHPFDPSGRVWLTYSSGLAVLNPGTSYLTYWAAPSGTWQAPFAHSDGKVWFSVQYSGVDAVARLNPDTNEVTEWPCRAGCDGLGRVHVDSTGKVWFTEDPGHYSLASYIGRLDPAAVPPAFTEWRVNCADITGAGCGSAAATWPRAVEFDSAGNVWMYFAYSGYSVYYRVARLTP